MEDFRDQFGVKEEPNFQQDMSKNDSPLLDMDSFETLEASINAASEFGVGGFSNKDLIDDPFTSMQSSAARPLVTSNDEDDFLGNMTTASDPSSKLLDFENLGKESSLIDYGAETRVDRDPSPSQPQQQQQSGGGDQLLIDDFDDDVSPSPTEKYSSYAKPSSYEPEPVIEKSKDFPIFEEVRHIVEEPKCEIPKIETKPKAAEEFLGFSASAPPAAQPGKSEVAMEAEKVGSASENKSDCDCPFSPGAWFNPNKLHPVVAKYVYWEDPKKSGVALGASLVLLLSLKYFSVISVTAYLTLALLSVTVSFRIYKNVLQAVQKSNDGHPFKDYLEMDIALSQEKISQTVETLIQHLNCVSMKLRSLILVEDLVDTIKLVILAWCMTYVGAWFNGLTLIILAVVSGFTLPKVYEANKTQIDAYAELVRTKGKEVIEMVNAKMPMGKKKKDQ